MATDDKYEFHYALAGGKIKVQMQFSDDDAFLKQLLDLLDQGVRITGVSKVQERKNV